MSEVLRFRKKPVIQAVAVSDLLHDAACNWRGLPEWIVDAYNRGSILFAAGCVYIQTLEGSMTGDLSDWIIQGVKGEMYPCKPDIFYETYDLVVE